MAERIDNPWWSEGWRLVRERLPEVVTPRRRRVLAVIVVASVLLGGGGILLLLRDIDGVSSAQGWGIRLLFALLVVDLSLGVCFLVWGHRDREPDYRAGRVSVGLEEAFDLRKPVPALSPELREEATIHIRRTQRALPVTIVGHGLVNLYLPIALAIMVVSGLWVSSAWIFLGVFLLNIPQPIWFLKWLGSTPAQLRRIESAPEPPAYRGPKGWGIEAPRKATEGDEAAG